MQSIAIVHFQPIEKYPPIINLLDYLGNSEPNQKIVVYTTWHNKNFNTYINKCEHIKIIRLKGISAKSTLVKVLQYFFLYSTIFFSLLKRNPFSILYYETLSVLPAFWYAKFKKVKILIHYHEYTSIDEYNSNSLIVRWLHSKEKSLYKSACWISHTNRNRLELFLSDENLTFNYNIHRLMPNYPSKNWAQGCEVKIDNNDYTTKFVYIGSVGLNTMYIKEFATFINSQNGKAIWDVYTNQFDDEAIGFLNKLNSKYINLKGAINYYDIPKVIQKKSYDVGLILYKGHINNYVYNAPNKLFEYIACNISVWYPNVMLGCKEYKNVTSNPLIYEVDFSNDIVDAFNNFRILTSTIKEQKTNNYYYENIYEEIVVNMTKTNA